MFESAELKLIAEDTLLIEFGDRLDDDLYSRVLALDSALNVSPVASHIETLPTFRSLMIRFDVFTLSFDILRDTLFKLDISNTIPGGQKWRVPVCLEGECAQDLSEVSAILNLSKASIVERLLASRLKLYMYGFAPGFAYLGGLDTKLHIARRDSPRSPMPKGALMIAGGLASLASVSMPTGWYVLGQTPVSMFELKRKSLVPFAVGDELQLYQVSLEDFAKLQASSDLEGVEIVTT